MSISPHSFPIEPVPRISSKNRTLIIVLVLNSILISNIITMRGYLQNPFSQSPGKSSPGNPPLTGDLPPVLQAPLERPAPHDVSCAEDLVSLFLLIEWSMTYKYRNCPTSSYGVCITRLVLLHDPCSMSSLIVRAVMETSYVRIDIKHIESEAAHSSWTVVQKKPPHPPGWVGKPRVLILERQPGCLDKGRAIPDS